MKLRIAHALRRIARKLIAWSNRLDGPTVRCYDKHWNPVPMPRNVVFEDARTRLSGQVN